MMLSGIGDVTAACGANPCGFTDYIWPSGTCTAWQTCAAQANLGYGTDAAGNTIVSPGTPTPPDSGLPCLTGPGPLQPGQSYCSGVLGDQAAASAAALNPPSVGAPQWLLLGLVVFGIAMVASR